MNLVKSMQTQERSLVYNETVVDLLNRDTEPVGLLNDLEKGTILPLRRI
jgi:hypothetical protein